MVQIAQFEVRLLVEWLPEGKTICQQLLPRDEKKESFQSQHLVSSYSAQSYTNPLDGKRFTPSTILPCCRLVIYVGT